MVGMDKQQKIILEIKNKLQKGDEMEIILPDKIQPYVFHIEQLWDIETDEPIDYVNPGRANQKVKLKLPIPVEEGYIIRRKKTK